MTEFERLYENHSSEQDVTYPKKKMSTPMVNKLNKEVKGPRQLEEIEIDQPH